MNVSVWCSKIIRWAFYLLFILVPLILTPWNYELFEYNKMMLTYGLTAIIFGAWLVKMLADKELRVTKTPLDIPIVLFVSSQLISTIFSIDRHISWFGYYSRFNGGMWSILSYVVLYYAFVTNMGDQLATLKKMVKDAANTLTPLPPTVKKLINAMVVSAAVVALYGVAEHLGIDRTLWVQDVQNRVFSTLGQPNWLAAYLAALFPLPLYFVFTNQPVIKNRKLVATTMEVLKYLFGIAISILFFIVTIYTRSRSGLLGLTVADLVFWLLVFLLSKNKKSTRLPFLIVHSAFFVIIFFNGVYVDQIDHWVTFAAWKNRITHQVTPAPVSQKSPAGTILESGGTESGTIRKYVWQAAVNAWRGSTKNMIIGTGTETFAFAFYQYRPAAHNLTSEWDFLYNKAHNEYLNYLATTGLFGLGSYIVLIGSFIFWFIKHQRINVSLRQSKNVDTFDTSDVLTLALFSGWISTLVTNFFGFSVVIMQVFLFLFPALTLVLIPNKEMRMVPLRLTKRMYEGFSLAILLLLLVLLVSLYRYWQADTLFANGYRLTQASQFAQAEGYVTKAIAINPGEPTYHDQLATDLASLVLSAVDQKNATLAATLAKQSLAENDTAIRISPKNVNFWKTRTKLFYTFSSFDPQLNSAAIQSLEMARTLSPNDPKIVYNLAILTGRDGNNDRAVELLQQAKLLKANYRDAYFGLYVFYTEMKNPDAARAQLQYYLDHVDPNDKDFQDRLASTK